MLLTSQNTLHFSSAENVPQRLFDGEWRRANFEYDPFEGSALEGDPVSQIQLRHDREYYHFSFTEQMENVLASTDRAPESHLGFFVTAKSAIPFAHTIRGYMAGLQRPEPIVSVIAANRENAPKALTTMAPEIERLATLITQHELTHVAILDQFVHTGLTLNFATGLLHRAGVARERIYPIAGKWMIQLHDPHEQAYELLDAQPAEHPIAGYFYMLGSLAAQGHQEQASTTDAVMPVKTEVETPAWLADAVIQPRNDPPRSDDHFYLW